MDLEILAATGTWSTPPVQWHLRDGRLEVEAREGSDAWRVTSYGFVSDNPHALLVPFAAGHALEVSFIADFDATFDQAGLMIRADSETWIKAGVEVADGVLQVGAVVTHGVSDWSAAPVPQWHGCEVTVRASRAGDAVTIRARVDQEPWQLVRVAPLDPAVETSAGLMCCAPTREGLTVTFTRVAITAADASLH